MNINPYDYMLQIRNNKILFSYLTECYVYSFPDDAVTELEWQILGTSSEGELSISPLVNGLLKLTIPIPTPPFFSVPMIGDILLGLQPTIEGLITFSHKKGVIYFDYNISFNPEDTKSLDKALLLFLKERAEIKEGFQFIIDDYKKLQSINTPSINTPSEELGSLWDTMEDIDNMNKIDDDDLKNDSDS